MDRGLRSASRAFEHAFGRWRSWVVYCANPVKKVRARAFYRQFVVPGAVCFDIGAHMGDRTAQFLKLGAKVVAVEPQPALAAALERRYRRDPRVSVVAAALGARAGRAPLALDPLNLTVATLSSDFIAAAGASRGFRRVRWREQIDVEVTTLDALIERFGEPSFCKIDVEGFELAVLEGLSRPLAALSLEYLPAALAPAKGAIARLERLGPYRFNHSRGESMRLAVPYWVDAAAMCTALDRIPADDRAGDIYARLDEAQGNR